MSGSAPEPETRVSYLKQLSPEQLVAFVDGVLEEHGASTPVGDADREPENVGLHTDAGRELIALAARRRDAVQGAIDLTAQCDVDNPDQSAHGLRN